MLPADSMPGEYPVVHTFIQYPSVRSPSLEQFLEERSALSCPASRMLSLEDAPEAVEPEHDKDFTPESPNHHTVIQWPVTRGPSLDEEADLAFENLQGCGSMDQHEMNKMLNAALELTQWPATQGLSLEYDQLEMRGNLERDQTFALWPATRGPSLEEETTNMPAFNTPLETPFGLDTISPVAVPWDLAMSLSPAVLSLLHEADNVNAMVPASFVQWHESQAAGTYQDQSKFLGALGEFRSSTEAQRCSTLSFQSSNLPALDSVFAAASEEDMCFPKASFQCSDIRNSSLEELMNAKASILAPKDPIECDASTAASSVEEDLVRELLLPSGFCDSCDEIVKDPLCSVPLVPISLTASLGIWSKGSAGHAEGKCSPCGFLWKGSGCQKAEKCEFCHLCPAGEVKRRKKEKLMSRKMEQMERSFASANVDW